MLPSTKTAAPCPFATARRTAASTTATARRFAGSTNRLVRESAWFGTVRSLVQIQSRRLFSEMSPSARTSQGFLILVLVLVSMQTTFVTRKNGQCLKLRDRRCVTTIPPRTARSRTGPFRLFEAAQWRSNSRSPGRAPYGTGCCCRPHPQARRRGSGLRCDVRDPQVRRRCASARRIVSRTASRHRPTSTARNLRTK